MIKKLPKFLISLGGFFSAPTSRTLFFTSWTWLGWALWAKLLAELLAKSFASEDSERSNVSSKRIEAAKRFEFFIFLQRTKSNDKNYEGLF